MHKKDMGVGAVSVLFGAWMFFMATKLKSGPAFWPKIVAAGIVILGVIIFVTAFVKLRTEGEPQEKKAKAPPQYGKVLIVLGILIAYYFAFQYIGYTIPTFLMIVGTAFTLGYQNWKVMIPTALAVSICLYLAFTQLFNVRFPGVFF